MENYLIVYHKEDNDGVMSCALMLKYLLEEMHISRDNITLLGANYNDLYDIVDSGEIDTWKDKYTHVTLTDISFRSNIMVKLYREFGNSIVWVDHHAPIIAESYKYKFDNMVGVRNIHRSAILNMYKYLYDVFDYNYTHGAAPELLRILSAYDSFTYEREGYEFDFVNSVNIGLNYKVSLDIDKMLEVANKLLVKQTDTYFSTKHDSIIYELNNYGSIITEYSKNQNKDLIANYGDLEWTVNGTQTACALFIQGPSNSTMFESVKDKVEHGIVLKKFRNGTWIMSLYNTNTDNPFHCGDYLKKKYKGGGHKGAAGCTITDAQVRKIMKNKAI